jgi:hypothetical protein
LNRLSAHAPKDRPHAAAVVQQLMSLEIATQEQRKSA